MYFVVSRLGSSLFIFGDGVHLVLLILDIFDLTILLRYVIRLLFYCIAIVYVKKIFGWLFFEMRMLYVFFMNKTLKIGTRASALALMQTEMVRAALAVVVPEVETEVVEIVTSGEWKPEEGETRLSTENGGKGQFTKEIAAALLAGEVDCAVHSMKDMETLLPEGLEISVMLPREDPRDVLLLSEALREKLEQNGGADVSDPFAILPHGATVGTASVRRQAFLLARRPDLTVVPFRGNVGTRIEKVRTGKGEHTVDATFLALAGLNRLGFQHEADVIIAPEIMLPAAGQGAVGIEFLSSRSGGLAFIGQLNCETTLRCVSAERAALNVLDGSCHTPIGAYATLINDGQMHLRLAVAALDGSALFEDKDIQGVQSVQEAVALGAALGTRLKAQLPADILVQKA